jgi:hypothetical protein
VQELRERRRVEERNREIVGILGILFGVRARRLMRSGIEGEVEGDEEMEEADGTDESEDSEEEKADKEDKGEAGPEGSANGEKKDGGDG